MVKTMVHRLVLLMASTTYSIWGPSRTLASGEAKLAALTMVCGQLCEKTTSERKHKGEPGGQRNEAGYEEIGNRRYIYLSYGTGWIVCFHWDKREAGISAMNTFISSVMIRTYNNNPMI